MCPSTWLPRGKTATTPTFPTEWYAHITHGAAPAPILEDAVTIDIGLILGDDATPRASAKTKATTSSAPASIGSVAMECVATLRREGVSPAHMVRLYQGQHPVSSWPQELHALATKAFQMAFKLGVDEAVLGAAETNDELSELMTEVEEQWYLGVVGTVEWNQGVAMGKRVLGVEYNTNDRTVHTRQLVGVRRV
jgi:hypothetical protein